MQGVGVLRAGVAEGGDKEGGRGHWVGVVCLLCVWLLWGGCEGGGGEEEKGEERWLVGWLVGWELLRVG